MEAGKGRGCGGECGKLLGRKEYWRRKDGVKSVGGVWGGDERDADAWQGCLVGVSLRWFFVSGYLADWLSGSLSCMSAIITKLI